MRKKAFINGTVLTMNPGQPTAGSVITVGNKIEYVGTQPLLGEQIEVIDLKGKLMLPGFIDSHVHFLPGGFSLNQMNLRKVNSKEEFQDKLRDHLSDSAALWIKGGDWNHHNFKENRLPDKTWIDEVVPDKPAYITRADLHMALVNSKALEIAGIDKNTATPPGGIIMKDGGGNPNGILVDEAMKLVSSIIPNPSDSEYNAALESALNEAAKQGITSVHDISLKRDFQTYQRFLNDGKLTCRIYSIHPLSEFEHFSKIGMNYSFGNDFLKLGGLKAFSDGSLGSATAWFFEPYLDEPDTCGLPTDMFESGKLKKLAFEADEQKLQLAIHAIGDRANFEMIKLYSEINKQNKKWDRRPRIEHVQHIRLKDIELLAEQNIIASVQPTHHADDGVWCHKKIGKERLAGTYPFKSMLDAGILLAFGSDWTVAELNVIKGIHTAVTRQTADGKNPGGLMPEEKISVEEAVKSYTVNGAFASFDEKVKGSIEPGKLADMVVLDKNIFTEFPNEIQNANIDMTIFNGDIIYRHD